MQIAHIDRANLNDTVEATLRGMIVDGSLSAGERLNEVHLAAGLGVSRTPVREALNRLMAEGAVETRPRLGYFVKPLTLSEFEQLYDIRPLLDPKALQLAGLPPPSQIEALERLNQRIARARSATARMALDDEWHLMLIARCPNRVLTDLIQNMMVRTRRYELAWMREADSADIANDGHVLIIQHLRAGHLDDACAALCANLGCAKPAIAAWLKTRKVGEREA
ncbi:MAG: GntR family transcriptional regulator [Hyphomonadaceae bacterium]